MSNQEVKPINPNTILLVLVGIIVILVFIIGRNSGIKEAKSQMPDISVYVKRIDSLSGVNKKYQDSVWTAKVKIDSLNKAKVINRKKKDNEIDKINNFTPSDRQRWNDSVLSAAGVL